MFTADLDLMSTQLRHAVNAKRGASAAPFSWKWPATRPPAAPRAADKSGEQCARAEGGPAAGPGTGPRDTKGPACSGRRGAGGGGRGEPAARRGCGHPAWPWATCVRRGRRGPGGTSGKERGPEDKGRAGGERPSGGAGHRGLGGHAGKAWGGRPTPRAARGAVRGASGEAAPRDRSAAGGGQLRPEGHSPQPRAC